MCDFQENGRKKPPWIGEIVESFNEKTEIDQGNRYVKLKLIKRRHYRQ